MVRQEGNRLVIEEGLTRVYIECWGESSLRVRMTAEPEMDKNDWALCERVEEVTPVISPDRYGGNAYQRKNYGGSKSRGLDSFLKSERRGADGGILAQPQSY